MFIKQPLRMPNSLSRCILIPEQGKIITFKIEVLMSRVSHRKWSEEIVSMVEVNARDNQLMLYAADEIERVRDRVQELERGIEEIIKKASKENE